MLLPLCYFTEGVSACLEATVDFCPLLARRANKRSKAPVEAARCTRETIEHEIHL